MIIGQCEEYVELLNIDILDESQAAAVAAAAASGSNGKTGTYEEAELKTRSRGTSTGASTPGLAETPFSTTANTPTLELGTPSRQATPVNGVTGDKRPAASSINGDADADERELKKVRFNKSNEDGVDQDEKVGEQKSTDESDCRVIVNVSVHPLVL